MPSGVLLTILVILGLVIAASAVMAVIAWIGVMLLRIRESRQGERPGRAQSISVANGLFELGASTPAEDEAATRR